MALSHFHTRAQPSLISRDFIWFFDDMWLKMIEIYWNRQKGRAPFVEVLAHRQTIGASLWRPPEAACSYEDVINVIVVSLHWRIDTTLGAIQGPFRGHSRAIQGPFNMLWMLRMLWNHGEIVVKQLHNVAKWQNAANPQMRIFRRPCWEANKVLLASARVPIQCHSVDSK